MSAQAVRRGLLALLAKEPMYGARLRSQFEQATGGTWPLNVGQVYTTLSRLERDGLVVGGGGADDEGRILYEITEAGHAEVDRWWADPIDHASDPRDELAIKIALAVTLPGVNAAGLLQAQRRSTLSHLQGLNRLKRKASAEGDRAWQLVLDRLLFAAEAEVRWLDHVDALLTVHPLPVASKESR
ncbi:PadR family transcriptional regulator [Solicola sp. PLA-1-18]|uniref:PadR family transcriptional regulator n=1 Tax=Solicola sp. PLA-1-18 TaxID=3380532 RepID=UPI003B7B0D36